MGFRKWRKPYKKYGKSFGKKKAYTSSAFTRRVKKIVKNSSVWKCADSLYNNTAVTSSGSITNLAPLTRSATQASLGTDNDDRTRTTNKVKIHKITYNLIWRIDDGTLATNADLNNYVRVIIGYFKDAYSSLAGTQQQAGGGWYGPKLPTNPEQVWLYDSGARNLHVTTFDAGGYASSSDTHMRGSITRGLPTITYRGNNSNDDDSGAPFILLYSDSGAGSVCHPLMTGWVRVWYSDVV